MATTNAAGLHGEQMPDPSQWRAIRLQDLVRDRYGAGVNRAVAGGSLYYSSRGAGPAGWSLQGSCEPLQHKYEVWELFCI